MIEYYETVNLLGVLLLTFRFRLHPLKCATKISRTYINILSGQLI